MKADDHQPSALPERLVKHRIERPFEVFQLVVDGDPQGLKRPRCRVMSAPPGRCGDDPRTEFGQLPRSANRRRAAPFDDLTGDPSGERFFTVPPQQLHQVRFLETFQPLPGRCALLGVEPQIERCIGCETEAAGRVGQLVGAETEIEQDAVDGLDTQIGQDGIQFGVAGLPQQNLRRIEAGFGQAQHVGVSVQSDEASRSAQMWQNSFCMAARSDGSVDDGLTRLRIEVTEHLPNKDRNVPW